MQPSHLFRPLSVSSTHCRCHSYYRTTTPFPFFNRRIPICETKHVILSPLENAVQLMAARVAALREAVQSKSATVISGILYGNVMTTISEGPEAVAEAFLASPNADAQTETLRQLMRDFLAVTVQALDLHEVIMSPDMKSWQIEARGRFATLEGKLKPHLG